MDAVAPFRQWVCLHCRLSASCHRTVVANVRNQIVPGERQKTGKLLGDCLAQGRCFQSNHLLGRRQRHLQRFLNQLGLLNAALRVASHK